MARDMENHYEGDPHPFGAEPTQPIVDIVPNLKPGTVADLGSGDGRNALYLAEQGFKVTAIDSLELPLNILGRRAIERGLVHDVDTVVADIATGEIGGPYDNIVAMQLLHFLGRDGFFATISHMQEVTSPGGINLLGDFAAGSEISHDPALAESDYYTDLAELTELYEGWEVLRSDMVRAPSKRIDETGQPIIQDIYTFAARKPD